MCIQKKSPIIWDNVTSNIQNSIKPALLFNDIFPVQCGPLNVVIFQNGYNLKSIFREFWMQEEKSWQIMIFHHILKLYWALMLAYYG